MAVGESRVRSLLESGPDEHGVVDRSERRRRHLASELKLFVDAIDGYGIFLLDTAGKIASWNAGAERIKGYSASEILGRPFSVFFTEDDRKAGVPERNLAAAVQEGRMEEEGWLIRKDGSRFWASVTLTALRDEDGLLHGFGKVVRDLSRERLHHRQIVEASDAVQYRIGRDLHDGLGQLLTGTAFLAKEIEQAASPALSQKAQRLIALIEQGIQTTQNLARGLAPIDLDSTPLAVALHDLASQTKSATGIDCRFDMQGNVEEAEPAIRTHVLLIAREAVANSVRHAQPRKIVLTLSMHEHQRVLAISDDGRGMVQPPESEGIGLRSMQQRARIIGGRLELTTLIGAGVRVRCLW